MWRNIPIVPIHVYIRWVRSKINITRMDFGSIFVSILGLTAILDGLWLYINTKFKFGVYFIIQDNFESSYGWTYPCSLLCWIISSLYLAGHNYETTEKGFIEGMWIGSLVYGIFNLTTCVVAPYWRKTEAQANFFQRIVPLVDTCWGTILFGIGGSLSALLQN